jgi:hypothetical protein
MPPNTMTKKRCGACREVKSLRSFHKDQRAADGHRSICKVCRAEGRTASVEEAQPVVNISEDVGMYLRGTHPHQMIDTPEDEWLVDPDQLRREWDKYKTALLESWDKPYPPWGWVAFEGPWPKPWFFYADGSGPVPSRPGHLWDEANYVMEKA